MKLLKIAAILALALVFCLGAVPAGAAGSPYDHLGETLPDFSVQTIDGGTFTLSQALEEKDLVMINLWATWCGPCEMEFPFMEEAYEQYRDKVEIIALSVEPEDTVEVLTAYAEDHGMTFPVGSDTETGLGNIFATEGIPTTLIVDRFGVITFIEVGSQPAASNFTRVFDAFIGDEYTESTPLNEMPPARPDVEPASEEDLAAALNAQGGGIVFRNDGDGYVWPMLPVEIDGRTAVVSSNGGNDDTAAAVTAHVTAAEGEALAFDLATSSESASDVLAVEIDGERVKVFGGEHDWRTWVLDLPAGDHEISFRYEKDFYLSVGEDCAWLDEVRLVSGEEAEALRAALPVCPTGDAFALTMASPDAKEIVFDGDENDLMAEYFYSQSYWIVPGGTAEVRIVPTADMDPEEAYAASNYDGQQLSVYDCLNEDGTACVFSTGIDSMETTGYSWTNIYAYPSPREEDADRVLGVMFFADEENVNALVDMIQAEDGVELSWHYADGNDPATGDAARGDSALSTYVISFVDQSGEPVPGCVVNFCTDEACVPVVADKTGTAVFEGAPFAYHLQVIRVPDGYEFDTAQEYYTDEAGGEMTFTVEKK